MHELLLDGKRYISSKRASEIASYSKDYVGQLCRAGKLDCRLVGRTWYVNERSIYSHKLEVQETLQAMEKNREKTAKSIPVAPINYSQVSVTKSAEAVETPLDAAPLRIQTTNPLPAAESLISNRSPIFDGVVRQEPNFDTKNNDLVSARSSNQAGISLRSSTEPEMAKEILSARRRNIVLPMLLLLLLFLATISMSVMLGTTLQYSFDQGVQLAGIGIIEDFFQVFPGI